MNTYTICQAIDVPHYTTYDIQAENIEVAIAIVKQNWSASDNEGLLFEPTWESTCNARIVAIIAQGQFLAHDIALEPDSEPVTQVLPHRHPSSGSATGGSSTDQTPEAGNVSANVANDLQEALEALIDFVATEALMLKDHAQQDERWNSMLIACEQALENAQATLARAQIRQ